MDWDQDGNLDILSGCYWTENAESGYIQILKGKGEKGELNFEEAVALKNANGKPLENINVTDDNRDGQTSSICTQQHAVDYDGDGDLDLIVGCFGPEFYYYENKADEENGIQTLSTSPVKLPIESPTYHSAPHLVDWDGDGDLDLLSGTGSGGVILSENTGTLKKPVWSDFKQLVDYSNSQNLSEENITMSSSTRVWATDFNGDGLLDLIVGDSANIVSLAEGVTAEEHKTLQMENRKLMMAAIKANEPLMKEYQKVMESGGEVSEDIQKEMEKNSQTISKLYKDQSKFQTKRMTGFVWLLIQKPGTQTVSKTAIPSLNSK